MLKFEFKYPAMAPSSSGGKVPFDPVNNTSHRKVLDSQIEKWKQKNTKAALAELDHIDADRHVAVLIDRSTTSIGTNKDGTKTVYLSAEHSKPNRGEEVRKRYEQDNPGYSLVVFHPYTSYALLEKLTEEQRTARDQIAAALKLHDWDIRVWPAADGGWHCQLDEGVQYQPSVMDKRMEQACEVVGHLGWFFEADPDTGVIDIHPGQPRTFPKLVAFPFDKLGDPSVRDRMPFGVQLARPGEQAEPAYIDWTQSLGLLCAGLSGGGKSVTINDVIALSVGCGAELYIADHSTKSTDFFWCRPWVADKGWGCDSLLQTAGMLKSILDDIEKDGARAKAWRDHGWQNWYDDLTPADKRKYPLKLLVVDELSQLTVGAKDASSLPRNPLPPVMERIFEQQVKSLIQGTLIKILQIGRAYGIRAVVATQVASSTTGMPPALRGNLGNKLVMGAKVNDAQKNLIFNIPRDVPDVPENVITEGVSKGSGTAEFEGQPPYCFKTAFPVLNGKAGVEALGQAMAERIGLPNGIGMDEYLDSLSKDTPSNPRYEDKVMKRIRFPESESYERYTFLQAIKQKWDEAIEAFGGGSTSGDDPDDGGDGPAGPAPVPSRPKDGPTPKPADGNLQDARELARIMRQG